MSKQLADMPVRPDEQVAVPAATTGSMPRLQQKKEPAIFWPWLGGMLVVGLVIVGIVTFSVWNWLNTVQPGMGGSSQSAAPVSTVNVGRSITYADLNVTWNSAQYTTSFTDDPIHAGAATMRVMLTVNNPTSNAIVITYYDVVRLLVPGQQPIVPTNLDLSAALQKGASQSGWIDFPVAQGTNLNTLKLQLGSAATSELLVTIPVTGSYNAAQYQPRTYHPALSLTYYFKGWNIPGYDLTYHLAGVDVRDSYNGTETKTGQQYYTLHFTVDNPNGVVVSPGLGFDYIRLAFNGGNRPPVDNTLPASF